MRKIAGQGLGDAYVTVHVCDGDAALEQLYIEGVPLREYSRRASATGQPPNE